MFNYGYGNCFVWKSIGDFKRFSTYRERVFVSSILLSINIVLERSLGALPLALATIIYSIASPESLPPTAIEFFRKWRLRLDPSSLRR